MHTIHTIHTLNPRISPRRHSPNKGTYIYKGTYTYNTQNTYPESQDFPPSPRPKQRYLYIKVLIHTIDTTHTLNPLISARRHPPNKGTYTYKGNCLGSTRRCHWYHCLSEFQPHTLGFIAEATTLTDCA